MAASWNAATTTHCSPPAAFTPACMPNLSALLDIKPIDCGVRYTRPALEPCGFDEPLSRKLNSHPPQSALFFKDGQEAVSSRWHGVGVSRAFRVRHAPDSHLQRGEHLRLVRLHPDAA